jgi:hypothetical protein
MSKWTRVSLVAVIVVSFVMGMSGTAAGQQAQAGADKVINQAAVQRSRAVQAELARIEANKEAFIDELFGRWAPYLDPLVYDLWGSLKPVAMAATPWRLLGASLTTDFESGLRVLRGVVGPGWYVSAYIEGREPVLGSGTMHAQSGVPDVGADALGDPQSSLVFKPIAPCRMVDTRESGARTGILTAGSTRAFDLSAIGLTRGQGGQASCPGLPTYNPKAWAVNITVVGYTENGHLTVWPFASSKPATSFLNFSSTAYAVANAGTVTGLLGGIDSINVSAFAPTHVIIDVMGYYEEATGFAGGAVTSLVGPIQELAANTNSYILGAACPAGTVIIGGQAYTGFGTLHLTDHRIVPGKMWSEWVANTHTYAEVIRVYSTCMDIQ